MVRVSTEARSRTGITEALTGIMMPASKATENGQGEKHCLMVDQPGYRWPGAIEAFVRSALGPPVPESRISPRNPEVRNVSHRGVQQKDREVHFSVVWGCVPIDLRGENAGN